MSGNPYLDAYEQQSNSPNAPDVYAAYRSRRLSRLKRLQEEQDRQDEATKAQSTFGQAPVEETPVAKRMREASEAFAREMRDYGAPEPETLQRFTMTRDPNLVQIQLDQEAQDEKDRTEFWKAVESGSQAHIDAALEGTAPAWDDLRKQRAEVEAAKEHLAKLDPATSADEILRAKPVLERAYKTLAEQESRLEDLAAKINAGVERRRVAGFEEAAGKDTIGARYAKVAMPTLAGVGKVLQYLQRGVAGAMGTASDVVAGRETDLRNLVPGLNLLTESGQVRGELAGKQWGGTMAPAFEAPAFVSRKVAELGEATPGPGGIIPSAYGKVLDLATDVTKPEGMSDEEWEATGRQEMRKEKFAKTAATGLFETITDPLAFLDAPLGSAAAKVLKPLEPVADAVSKFIGAKKTAAIIRDVVKSGAPLEDPRWAEWAIKSKAANVEASAPLIEEAYRAERSLQAELSKLPPELQKDVADVAPRVLESIPAAERGGLQTITGPKNLSPNYAPIPAPQQPAENAIAEAVRGKTWFHGTRGTFGPGQLGSEGSDAAGLYGPGLYLTDTPEIARGYAKNAKGAGNVYETRLYPKKVFDAEAPFVQQVGVPRAEIEDRLVKTFDYRIPEADSDFGVDVRRMSQDLGITEEAATRRLLRAEFDKLGPNATWDEYLRTVKRAFSSDADHIAVPAIFDRHAMEAYRDGMQELSAYLSKDLGFDGLTHTGGKLTGAPEHRVVVLFDPRDTMFSKAGVAPQPLQEALFRKAETALIPAATETIPSAKYAEVLKDIPAEYRAQAVAYAEAKGANAELRAAMAKDRGVNIELADNALEGYAERRFDGAFRLHMAQNPELAKAFREMKLTPLEGRNAKEYTFDEVEEFLRKKSGGWSGDIWDRSNDFVAAKDWLFVADAVKRRKELETFAEVFGKDAGGNIPEGAVMGQKLSAELGVRDAIPGLENKWFSKTDVEQMKKLQHLDTTPSGWRAKINRVTNWVARSVLANPASLSKDLKGQVGNFFIATGDKGVPHLDESLRAISKTGGAPDRDHAELIAAGLDRPSFDAEIRPSVIDATREFGGSKVAGAIEESGFIGAGVRGIGKGLEAAGLPRLGKGVQSVGKGIGATGNALLRARQESEAVFRLATYKAAKARGLSRAEALNEVAKYWGDFSQLTKLESSVLKGFVLFFSWQLRAMKIGMHQILDHPFRTRLFLSLAAGNVSDDPTFPDWARRQGGSIMGRDSAGNPKFISLGAGSYFEPIGDLLQGEVAQRLRTDGLAGVPVGIAKAGLRRLAPAFQAPIEYATNYDSFSGGQIYLEPGQDTAKTRTSDHAPTALYWVAQYFPKLAEALDIRPVYRSGTKDLSYVHMNPRLNWLFNKVAPGVGAQLGPVNAAADPRKDMWEAASRALLGTPTYSVREQDLKAKVGAQVRTMTEALRKSVNGTGLAVNQDGGVYFDKTSELGQQMLEDDARWGEEAKREGYNPEAYRRLKMGAKYQKQLYLIDLGKYLNGWVEALEAPFPEPLGKTPDATSGLRRLGKQEARRDEVAERRALRRR